MATKYTLETDTLYQYSVGYRLLVPKAYSDCVTQFYSEDYPDGMYVDSSSYIKDGAKTYCPVPAVLTVNTHTLIVYAYSLEDGRAITQTKTVIPIHERPRPADSVIDPTDVITYATVEELISQMREAIASENARVEAEALRAEAETERATAEALRGAAEATRESTETDRELAEEDRVEAEALRELAETSRATAEASRISAEASRVQTWTNATATATDGDTPSASVTVDEDGVEFDFTLVRGLKGEKGDDGYTPIKGVDYNDGYTPVKGIDYFDGEKGDIGDTGNGIASVELVSGTHAAGTVDTYRITMTNGTTFDFNVYNGANGEGAGDMMWAEWNNRFNPNNVTGQLALKSEIPSVPTKLSQLSGDSTHRVVTDGEKASWNSKADASTYATTGQYGLTKLSSSTSSTSTSLAATPSAVRSAYNLANGKYSKPSGGIPSTDMTSAVQTSLSKADTALQEHQDISGKANKMTTSTFTLLASGWTDNTYALGYADSDLEIELDASATDEMLEAWSNAKMVGSASSNTLTAKGDVPTIDITCILKRTVK